jgi:hypothetical protein
LECDKKRWAVEVYRIILNIMIHFDKKTLEHWEKEGVQNISLFFYESGCAGTKIGVETQKLADCESEIKQDSLHIYMRRNEV